MVHGRPAGNDVQAAKNHVDLAIRTDQGHEQTLDRDPILAGEGQGLADCHGSPAGHALVIYPQHALGIRAVEVSADPFAGGIPFVKRGDESTKKTVTIATWIVKHVRYRDMGEKSWNVDGIKIRPGRHVPRPRFLAPIISKAPKDWACKHGI